MGIDVAIDLGTSRTRIFLQNKGKVVDEPSVITVNLEDESILAVGEEAYHMLGRTSDRFNAMYPINGGVISDLGLVEAMISIFLKKVKAFIKHFLASDISFALNFSTPSFFSNRPHCNFSS